jgi:cobalt-precorrin-5B (C1)-methyltransferase
MSTEPENITNQSVRPESDYSRPTKRDPQGMRTGYTTGTTAAAAAKAAVILMLSGKAPEEVSVPLPGGRGAATLKVHNSWAMEPSEGVRCSVIKDGGDDPDVTHGAEIIVGVWRLPDGNKGLQITGGPGVGTVTRPGTGIEVGEPAVTRVPRRMIADAVAQGLVACGWPADTGVRARISVPNGEEIAKQTTNARLGVLNGISILGSTGIVQPFSTAAWRASVHLAIDVAATNGLDHLVLSTGTRSEQYTRELLDLPDMAYVEAGIFSGPSMKRCVNKGIKRVAHVGMVGKFSKMAMGYFVTHVAGNQVDTGFLAELAAQCGASPELQEEMRNASSGRHFQELAQEHGVMEVFPVMCQLVCQEAQKYLGQDSDTDPGDAIIVDALCFDFEGNLLGSASTSADGIPMRDPSVATVNVEG